MRTITLTRIGNVYSIDNIKSDVPEEKGKVPIVIKHAGGGSVETDRYPGDKLTAGQVRELVTQGNIVKGGPEQ